MTAKEFVKSKYPKAKKERHVTRDRRVYFLIRNGNDYMYLSSGDTESKAWVNAKEIILKSK